MGNWTLIIEGTGCHHNKDVDADADRMARQFVGELRARGHSIEHASLTYSGRENLNVGGYCDLRERKIDQSAVPTCLSLDEIKEIETSYSGWNNENFGKLLDSVKVLMAERDAIKLKLQGLAK